VRRGAGCLTLLLAVLGGFVAGALTIVVLAYTGERGNGAETRTRPSVVDGATSVTVPDVLDRSLGEAQDRLRGDGFEVELSGGGLLGPLVESNWVVRGQSPQPGASEPPGSKVTLEIARR